MNSTVPGPFDLSVVYLTTNAMPSFRSSSLGQVGAQGPLFYAAAKPLPLYVIIRFIERSKSAPSCRLTPWMHRPSELKAAEYTAPSCSLSAISAMNSPRSQDPGFSGSAVAVMVSTSRSRRRLSVAGRIYTIPSAIVKMKTVNLR